MGEKFLVTTRPANSPEQELELDIDDFPGAGQKERFEAMAQHAREAWWEMVVEGNELQLQVNVEHPGDKESGRFGTGETQETEEQMLARMRAEAETEAGLA